MAQSNVYNYVL